MGIGGGGVVVRGRSGWRLPMELAAGDVIVFGADTPARPVQWFGITDSYEPDRWGRHRQVNHDSGRRSQPVSASPVPVVGGRSWQFVRFRRILLAA